MKNNFLKNLSSDFERGFSSFGILISMFGTILVIILGAWDKLAITDEMRSAGIAAGYHFSMVLESLKSEAANIAIPILSTLPLSGMFLEEYRSRFNKICLIRTSRKNYVISKVIATGICGGAGILFGLIIITGIFALIYSPMELKAAEETGKLFIQFVQSAFLSSMLGILFASLGALLGTAQMSTYMAYGGPFLINYLLIILITRYFPNIYVLNPKEWMLHEHYFSDNPTVIFLLLLELCMIIMLLEGIAIWKKIE
ncbi:MAG: hypothetical protein K0S76_1552 [Herbinix sp.]|jgi:hypothetical protein|nr:hypothetical protein [Herbinix sp.]